MDKLKMYWVQHTENTNAIAEKTGVNYGDKPAVLLWEKIKTVCVRVRIGEHGDWSEPIELLKTDLMEYERE